MPAWLNVYLPFICQTQINSGRDETLRWQTSIKGWCCRSDRRNRWQSRATLGLPLFSNVYQDFLFWDSLINRKYQKERAKSESCTNLDSSSLRGMENLHNPRQEEKTAEGKANHCQEIFTKAVYRFYQEIGVQALKFLPFILKIGVALKCYKVLVRSLSIVVLENCPIRTDVYLLNCIKIYKVIYFDGGLATKYLWWNNVQYTPRVPTKPLGLSSFSQNQIKSVFTILLVSTSKKSPCMFKNAYHYWISPPLWKNVPKQICLLQICGEEST